MTQTINHGTRTNPKQLFVLGSFKKAFKNYVNHARGKTEKEMLIARGHLAKTSGERGQGLRSDFGHTVVSSISLQ